MSRHGEVFDVRAERVIDARVNQIRALARLLDDCVQRVVDVVDVVAGAAVHVGAAAAVDEDVVPVAADQRVVADAAHQGVVATAAAEQAVAAAGVDLVGAVAAVELAAAGSAQDDVGAVAGDDQLWPGAQRDRVVAVADHDHVMTIPGLDRVVAVAGIDHVVAGIGDDDVVAIACLNHVVAGVADDRAVGVTHDDRCGNRGSALLHHRGRAVRVGLKNLRRDRQRDVGRLANRTVGTRERAVALHSHAVVDAELAIAVQADRGDAQLVEGLELAGLRLAVAIGVDPDAQLAPARVEVADHAVVVRVEAAQAFEVGARIGRVLLERDLRAVVDHAVVVGVQRQDAVATTHPARLVGKAVLTIRHEGVGLVDGLEVESGAVQVEDDRRTTPALNRWWRRRRRKLHGHRDLGRMPIWVCNLKLERVLGAQVQGVGDHPVPVVVDTDLRMMWLAHDAPCERGKRNIRIGRRSVALERQCVVADGGASVDVRRKLGRTAVPNAGLVRLGELIRVVRLASAADDLVAVVAALRILAADDRGALVHLSHVDLHVHLLAAVDATVDGVVETSGIPRIASIGRERDALGVRVEVDAAVDGVGGSRDIQQRVGRIRDLVVVEKAARPLRGIAMGENGHGHVLLCTDLVRARFDVRKIVYLRHEDGGLAIRVRELDAAVNRLIGRADGARGQVKRGHLLLLAVHRERAEGIVDARNAQGLQRTGLSGVDLPVAVQVAPDLQLREDRIVGVDDAVAVGVEDLQAADAARLLVDVRIAEHLAAVVDRAVHILVEYKKAVGRVQPARVLDVAWRCGT